jgi:hypothetical protein
LANIEKLTNLKPAAITAAAPRDSLSSAVNSSAVKEMAAVECRIVEDDHPNEWHCTVDLNALRIYAIA